MKKGKLIVFEGISGTGKETQAHLLNDFFQKKGIASHIVFHPSPQLKTLLSDWRATRNIDHIAEAYLLLADRSDRVRQIVVPALENGEWVICLRNWISALVYQAKTEEERAWMKENFLRFEPPVDALFHFDITHEQARARITKRHEETGEPLGKFETPEELEKKRNGYKEVMNDIPHVAIDAARSIEAIHSQIVSEVQRLI